MNSYTIPLTKERLEQIEFDNELIIIDNNGCIWEIFCYDDIIVYITNEKEEYRQLTYEELMEYSFVSDFGECFDYY